MLRYGDPYQLSLSDCLVRVVVATLGPGGGGGGGGGKTDQLLQRKVPGGNDFQGKSTA